MNTYPLLTCIVFLPLVTGLAGLAVQRRPNQVRLLCLISLIVEFLLLLAIPFITGAAGLVLREDFAWIAPIHVRYTLEMDGFSYVMAILTVFLGGLGILASWREIDRHVAGFHALLMASLTSALGVFLAQDVFLFYLFWELQLVPMFFLIGRYGHEERRKAATKFVLFSIAGGLPLLLAVIQLMLTSHDLSLASLAASPPDPMIQNWLFAAFVLAFAVKTPLVPVHTWLPDAHTQAPTAGSLLLAGVLLKTGAYAMLRWALPLFPHTAAAATPWLAGIGVLGLFYASWIALSQTDLKRLVAYSSVAHMGMIMLGLAADSVLSLSGAVLQMISHALTTGGLFIMVGMLVERTHSREFAVFGGMWKRMPIFGAFFLFFAMAAAGLPGLSQFVGEIMILMGSFAKWPVLTVIALGGLVVGLAYILKMVQATLYGPVNTSEDIHFVDLCPREIAVLVPLALAVLWLGVHPSSILDIINGPLVTLATAIPK